MRKKKVKKWSKSERETIALLVEQVQQIFRVCDATREISVPFSDLDRAMEMPEIKDLCQVFRFHIQSAIA